MALPPGSIAILLAQETESEEQHTHQQEAHSRYSRAYQRIRQLCAHVVNMIRRGRHRGYDRRITDG